MIDIYLRLGYAAVVIAALSSTAIATADNSDTRDLGSRFAQRIGALRPAESERPVLRVVYFHAADRTPLADYIERWQRILDDIRGFYRDEMERNGFGPITFDYERDGEGGLRVHVVKGRHPSARYDYDTGQAIREEARAAIGNAFDLDTSYTLFVHGLCDSLGDCSYRFHAPYYGEGWSNWQGGICHVADCPLLDPDLLTDTSTKIQYVEHTGKFQQTTAAFNTKYLGGVAHELGHGFGLPHNAQWRSQLGTLGTALMGSGNHTYRREVWSNRKGSFLTLASAMSLAVHPLFAGYSPVHERRPNVTLLDGAFDDEAGEIRFRGRFESNIEPLAIIAYADPDGRSNYDAPTAVGEVIDGRVDMPLNFDRLRDGELRLLAVLRNGGIEKVWSARMDTVGGIIDVQSLKSRELLKDVEVAYFGGRRVEARQLATKAMKDFASSRQAKLFQAVVDQTFDRAPVELESIQADSVSLANVEWQTAKVGWMRPARNIYAGEPNTKQHRFLMIAGQPFVHGLYAHAPSRYVFDLDGQWTTFQTTIGFQDGGNNEAIWKVLGDGEVLIKSTQIAPGKSEDWKVSVEGIDRLELVIESTRRSNGACWTIWGDPRLTR